MCVPFQTTSSRKCSTSTLTRMATDTLMQRKWRNFWYVRNELFWSLLSSREEPRYLVGAGETAMRWWASSFGPHTQNRGHKNTRDFLFLKRTCVKLAVWGHFQLLWLAQSSFLEIVNQGFSGNGLLCRKTLRTWTLTCRQLEQSSLKWTKTAMESFPLLVGMHEREGLPMVFLSPEQAAKCHCTIFFVPTESVPRQRSLDLHCFVQYLRSGSLNFTFRSFLCVILAEFKKVIESTGWMRMCATKMSKMVPLDHLSRNVGRHYFEFVCVCVQKKTKMVAAFYPERLCGTCLFLGL